jgi:2-C-methyl-D-erythritol 2,4-cyclodiphosphate synthase
LGDIGELFPNSDEANRGRNSAEMLQLAYQRVRQSGYAVVNVDCIVFAQRPPLGPHKQAIRRRIADLLGVDPGAIGVKAKTGEGVGPVGREEAIMAECVVLLEGNRGEA